MKGKVTCSSCGWSWNKSDSSQKDMYICHECGRDNSNNMKNGGWLDNYADGGSMQEYQENYNNSSVSLPEGFVGMGNNTKGRNYSPAWGGQFQMGGSVYPVNYVPQAQDGKLTFLQPTSDKLPQGYRIPYSDPSSERAMSIGGEDGEPAYLIPSFKYGQPLDDPMGEFRKTREHLGGPFKTWQEADEWERTVRHPAVEKGENIMFPQEQFQNGGKKKPIYVESKNDPRYKAYQDSLLLYNLSERQKLKGTNNKENILFNRKGSKLQEIAKDYGYLDIKEGHFFPNSKVAIQIHGEDDRKKPNSLENEYNNDEYVHPTIAPIKGYNWSTETGFTRLIESNDNFLYKKPQQPVIVKPTTTKETTKPKSKYWTAKDVPADNWKKFIKEHPGAIGMDPDNVDKNGFHLPIYQDKPKAIQNNLRPEGLVLGNTDLYSTLPTIRPAARNAKSYKVKETVQGKYAPSTVDYEVTDPRNINMNDLGPGNTRVVTPEYAMGGSIPGAVGFSYARTQSPAPSNGPYAKKTMPSAENGGWLSKYEQAQDGYQTGDKVTYGTPEYTEAYNKGEVVTEDGQRSPILLDEVVVQQQLTPLLKAKLDYGKVNDEDAFVNAKKDEYIKSLGSSNWFGADKNNFPENVLRDINAEYDYNKNTKAIESVAKEKGFDLNTRDNWIYDLTPSERESLMNSKYSSQLNPNEFAEMASGVQQLGNTIASISPWTSENTFDFNIPGLTQRELEEDRDSNFSALKTFAPLNIPGNAAANYLKNSSDWVEQPTLGMQRMGNVDIGDSMAFNPINLSLITGAAKLLPNIPGAVKSIPRLLDKGKDLLSKFNNPNITSSVDDVVVKLESQIANLKQQEALAEESRKALYADYKAGKITADEYSAGAKKLNPALDGDNPRFELETQLRNLKADESRNIIKKIPQQNILKSEEQLGEDVRIFENDLGSNNEGVYDLKNGYVAKLTRHGFNPESNNMLVAYADKIKSPRTAKVLQIKEIDGKVYQVQNKATGVPITELSETELKNIPKEHIDNFWKDKAELDELGLSMDIDGGGKYDSNIFYDPKKGFQIIDLGIGESPSNQIIADTYEGLRLPKTSEGLMSNSQISENIFGRTSLSDKEKEMYKWFENQLRFDKLPKTENKKSLGVLEDFKTRIETPEGKRRLKELGISDSEAKELHNIKIVEDPNTFGYYRGDKNTIAMNPNHPLPGKVVRHEVEHAVQSANASSRVRKLSDDLENFKYLFRPKKAAAAKYEALKPTSEIDDMLSGLELRKEGTPGKTWSNAIDDKPIDISEYKPKILDRQNATDYFLTGTSGKEKSAFLSEVQQYMMDKGMIPKNSYVEITPEMIKKTFMDAMFDEVGGGKYLRIFNIMKPTQKNYELLAKGLNKMLTVTGVGAVGVGAASQIEKKKQGGIIKGDQDGYRNPKNRGKVVEILGDTMGTDGYDDTLYVVPDVGEPRIVYANTGNHTFPGATKFTEYPMAKNGIRQEQKGLQNLDQLTNFTNYNTKQSGGWLDKFEEGGQIPQVETPTLIGPQNAPIPMDGGYVVKQGDTLGKIARETGISVDKIARSNDIKNPNFIKVGQELVLPSIAQSKPLPEKYQDWNVIKKKTNDLNKLDDLKKIVSYHQNTPDEIYSVVDKKNAKLNIYKGGSLIKSFEIGTGAKPGDAQTVTKQVNGKTNWDSGNKSTGAGIYTVSNIDPASDEYYGLPSFNLKNEQGIEVATSIHGTPKGRRKYFNNNTIADNRMSNGCINGKCQDLPEMYKYIEEGSKVYILPEDKGNTFQIVDGKPVFRVDPKNAKGYETYVDKKGVKQKGQGVNRSTNTLVYKPINAVFNEDKFKDDVFQWNDLTDKKEYKQTTKPFIKSLEENKKKIMQAAKVPSDVYNEIAKMTFGIYGAESNYGDTHSAEGNFARALVKLAYPKGSSSPDYKAKATTYAINSDERSVGMTQLRWSYLNAKEKSVLKKLGITSNKEFLEPTKAAMGTAAVLAVRYNEQLDEEQKKDMWKYLPKKWNTRDNYSERVKQNSSYLNFQQLNPIINNKK